MKNTTFKGTLFVTLGQTIVCKRKTIIQTNFLIVVLMMFTGLDGFCSVPDSKKYLFSLK